MTAAQARRVIVGGALTGEDERREIERLRAEVGDLAAKLAQAQERAERAEAVAAGGPEGRREPEGGREPGARARRRRLGWRGPVATLLIVLGCVLAPVSVLAVWSANQVSNTSKYVENVAPLISEPAVQNALTDRITKAITDELDVQKVADQAAKELSANGLNRLGDLVSNFSGSIASGVTSLIHETVAKIVSSSLAQRLWIQGNRVAHEQLVKALSGQASALSVSNGQVVISLGPFIDQVERDLAAHGLTLVEKLPPINPSFSLFSAKYLVQAQSAYQWLNTLKWVLPILTLVLLAAGIYVARRHRRALLGAGLGVAGSMLVLAAALAVGRAIYLDTIPPSVSADAAGVTFDTLVRFVKDGLRVVAVVGLIVAIGAFFTGPSVTAARTRGALASWLGWVRGTGERAGLTTGPVGAWVYRHRRVLRIGAVAVAALIFVFWTDPTGLVALVIAIILLVALGLIELIGRPPAARKPERAPR